MKFYLEEGRVKFEFVDKEGNSYTTHTHDCGGTVEYELPLAARDDDGHLIPLVPRIVYSTLKKFELDGQPAEDYIKERAKEIGYEGSVEDLVWPLKQEEKRLEMALDTPMQAILRNGSVEYNVVDSMGEVYQRGEMEVGGGSSQIGFEAVALDERGKVRYLVPWILAADAEELTINGMEASHFIRQRAQQIGFRGSIDDLVSGIHLRPKPSEPKQCHGPCTCDADLEEQSGC